MTNRKKLSKKGLLLLVGGIVLVIILIFVSVNLIFRFDPLRNQPDEIVVYKYGTTYTLTPADEAFQVLYQQLRDAWKVEWKEQLMLDSYKSNLEESDIFFFDSGLAIQVKYNKTQTARGIGTAGSKYDNLIFLLDFPQELTSEMSELDRSAIESLIHKDDYVVYYSSRESPYNLSFIHYNYPQEAKDYILQHFND